MECCKTTATTNLLMLHVCTKLSFVALSLKILFWHLLMIVVVLFVSWPSTSFYFFFFLTYLCFYCQKNRNGNSCSDHVIYFITSYPHGCWSLSKAPWTSWPAVPLGVFQGDKKQQSFPLRQVRVASWLVVSMLRDKDLSELGSFRGTKVGGRCWG